MSEPGRDDGSTPVWGAGNVVLRSGQPPVRRPLWARIAVFLGTLVLVVLGAALPLFGLAMMGAGRDDAYFDDPVSPVASPPVTVTAVPAAFAGRWAGTAQYYVDGEQVASWTVQIDLKEGGKTGLLTVRERACSLKLTEFSGTTTYVDLSRGFGDETPSDCLPPGSVRLNLVLAPGVERMEFEWMQFGDPDPGSTAITTNPTQAHGTVNRV